MLKSLSLESGYEDRVQIPPLPLWVKKLGFGAGQRSVGAQTGNAGLATRTRSRGGGGQGVGEDESVCRHHCRVEISGAVCLRGKYWKAPALLARARKFIFTIRRVEAFRDKKRVHTREAVLALGSSPSRHHHRPRGRLHPPTPSSHSNGVSHSMFCDSVGRGGGR